LYAFQVSYFLFWTCCQKQRKRKQKQLKMKLEKVNCAYNNAVHRYYFAFVNDILSLSLSVCLSLSLSLFLSLPPTLTPSHPILPISLSLSIFQNYSYYLLCFISIKQKSFLIYLVHCSSFFYTLFVFHLIIYFFILTFSFFV